MEVDRRPALELGDLGERHDQVVTELRARYPTGRGEVATYGGGEPVPQSPGVRVPQHVARVVVAVRAQWQTDQWVILGVHQAAAHPPPVLAARIIPARTAPFAVHHAVHRPERRGGQGHEQPGTLPYRIGHTLAAGEARTHELEGVPSMQARARLAYRGTPVAATHGQPLARLSGRRIGGDHLTRDGIGGDRGTGEVDRIGAAADRLDLFLPTLEERVFQAILSGRRRAQSAPSPHHRPREQRAPPTRRGETHRRGSRPAEP